MDRLSYRNVQRVVTMNPFGVRKRKFVQPLSGFANILQFFIRGVGSRKGRRLDFYNAAQFQDLLSTDLTGCNCIGEKLRQDFRIHFP